MPLCRPALFVVLVASCEASTPPKPVETPVVLAEPVVTASVTAPPPVETVEVPRSTNPVFESGFASWYGAALAGHKTASGQRFDPSKLTAAHRTLKLGTWVEVKRTDNGRVVRVLVNDRGPVSHRFVIDLSSEAARQLGMLKMGVAPVELRLVAPP